jgi:Tfp pilus assembly protein PilF
MKLWAHPGRGLCRCRRRCYCIVMQGEHDRAGALYERALQVDPANAMVWFDLGVRAAAAGDAGRATAK